MEFTFECEELIDFEQVLLEYINELTLNVEKDSHGLFNGVIKINVDYVPEG